MKITNLLSKHQRKRLLEGTWSKFMEEDSNPSLTKKRIVENSNTALQDLTLLAKKLPNDEFQNIFKEKSIVSFYKSLLHDSERLKDSSFSSDTELASLIASVSIKFCRERYASLNRYTPHISQTVVEHLDRSIAIIEEIGHKIQLEHIEKETTKKNQRYICRIEEISGKDKTRFIDFATEELDLGIDLHHFHIDIKTRQKEDNRNLVSLTFAFEEGGDEFGKIVLDIDYGKSVCKFFYYSNTGDTLRTDGEVIFGRTHVVEKTLIVKPYGRHHLLLK